MWSCPGKIPKYYLGKILAYYLDKTTLLYKYKKRKTVFIIFTCKNMKRNKKVYVIFFLILKIKRLCCIYWKLWKKSLSFLKIEKKVCIIVRVSVMMFNATFNNISVIWWRSLCILKKLQTNKQKTKENNYLHV